MKLIKGEQRFKDVIFIRIVMLASLLSFLGCKTVYKNECVQKSIYDFELKTIDGKPFSTRELKGKVLIFVNVASKCAFTPQYEELQKFYEQFKDRELVVLGFPSNDFLWQEPADNATIAQFCSTKYNVTFPMFEKISVKGSDCHPLYQFLTQKKHNGKLDCPIKWNFQKIIVDKNGQVVKSIAPSVSILAKENIQFIETLL
jgi:glutathione peroxidase